MAFFNRFKQLNQGVLRLLWTFALVITAVFMMIYLVWAVDIWTKPYYAHDAQAILITIAIGLALLLGPFVGFWLVARWVLWIIDGFKNSKRKQSES